MSTLDALYYAVLSVGGVYATLVGFRVVRGSRAPAERYELWWGAWGKHLRWLGPLVVVGVATVVALRLGA